MISQVITTSSLEYTTVLPLTEKSNRKSSKTFAIEKYIARMFFDIKGKVYQMYTIIRE